MAQDDNGPNVRYGMGWYGDSIGWDDKELYEMIWDGIVEYGKNAISMDRIQG